MIGTLDVKINAAHPNLPLAPFYTFVSSPSSVRVTNVPKKIGSWEITKVFVTANYPDNTSRSAECVNVAGCYVATLPLCNVVGESVNGFQITANGVDENGNAVTGYVLGHGDLIVLTRAGNITVGTTTWYFNFKDTQPTNPVKGDACIINGSLKWYNGTAWVDFGGLNLSDITLDLNADQATINEKLGEVIRRAGGTVIGCLAALLALSGLAAHEYPTNPDPSHKEFFGKMTRDSLVVTNAPDLVESDPVFTAWKGTNTYVKVETDPTVPAWAKAANPPAETDPVFSAWYALNPFAAYAPRAWVQTNFLGVVTYRTYQKVTNKVTFTQKVSMSGDLDVNGDLNVQGETFVGGQLYGCPLAGENLNIDDGGDIKIGGNKVVYSILLNGVQPLRGDVTLNVPTCYEPNPALANRAFYANEADSAAAPRINGVVSSWTDMCRTYEVDPTVPTWAKAASKPTYTAAEVGAAPLSMIDADNATFNNEVTEVIRSKNGGLWDASLQVWWTPVMSNGKLTYQATTNVNLNAGN